MDTRTVLAFSVGTCIGAGACWWAVRHGLPSKHTTEYGSGCRPPLPPLPHPGEGPFDFSKFEEDEVVAEHLTRNVQFFGLPSQKRIAESFVVVVGLGVSDYRDVVGGCLIQGGGKGLVRDAMHPWTTWLSTASSGRQCREARGVIMAPVRAARVCILYDQITLIPALFLCREWAAMQHTFCSAPGWAVYASLTLTRCRFRP